MKTSHFILMILLAIITFSCANSQNFSKRKYYHYKFKNTQHSQVPPQNITIIDLKQNGNFNIQEEAPLITGKITEQNHSKPAQINKEFAEKKLTKKSDRKSKKEAMSQNIKPVISSLNRLKPKTIIYDKSSLVDKPKEEVDDLKKSFNRLFFIFLSFLFLAILAVAYSIVFSEFFILLFPIIAFILIAWIFSILAGIKYKHIPKKERHGIITFQGFLSFFFSIWMTIAVLLAGLITLLYTMLGNYF